MKALVKRNLKAYASVMLLYIFAAFLVFYIGINIWENYFTESSDHMMKIYSDMANILVLFIPLLTMGSFTLEKAGGTDRILFTSSLNMPLIVLGKYLAAFTAFSAVMLAALIIPSVILMMSGVYFAEVLSMIIGELLIGSAVIAFGLFISSLSSHEYRAFVVTVAGLFGWWVIDTLMHNVSSQAFKWVLNGVSIFDKYQLFSNGFISLSAVFFLLSVTALFLLFAVQSLLIWRGKR